MGELGPMMNTNSYGSSENRHQEPTGAGESRPANGSNHAWPSRPVPAWSVPPGLLGPAAGQPEPTDRPDRPDQPEPVVTAEATPADPGPAAGTDDDWPGAAPPA